MPIARWRSRPPFYTARSLKIWKHIKIVHLPPSVSFISPPCLLPSKNVQDVRFLFAVPSTSCCPHRRHTCRSWIFHLETPECGTRAVTRHFQMTRLSFSCRSWSCGLDIKEHWPTMSLDIVITAHPHSDGFLHVLLFLPSDVSFYKSILVIHAKKPNHIISSFSSSTHLHLMSTTQLPWDLRLQQDCPLGHVHHGVVSGDDYTAKRYQVLECTVSPSANGIPVPPLDYPQGAQRVESPLKNVFENEALFMAPTSVSSYQGTLWGSQFVQANYPSSTSSTIYADDNGRSSIIEGQPIQLSPHTIPLPIAQARPSFHGDSFDRPLTNATTRRSEGGVQDRASDERAFAHLSLNSSTPLPHATGYTSMYPQDNGSASRPGQPPFVHHANTGSTVDQASSTVHRGFTVSQRGWPDYYTDVSSRSPFPNPVLPSIQGPYPSSYPDDENLAIPLEPTENSDPFTGQSYPPPNEPTEVSHSRDVPSN
ncbi:hypothetical protein EDD17DRAFT_1588451 [Pisolithus thermaeus]|nr:hypothetical protein EDD17DRAFT_1588451 [Pisolithus thermaeus]